MAIACGIHPDKPLSELIQRRLTGARAKQIASYLASAPDRFFNSLVLATYAGAPEWLEVGNLRSSSQPNIVKEMRASTIDALMQTVVDAAAERSRVLAS